MNGGPAPRPHGMTLIELMIALALGLLLMAAIYRIFLATSRTSTTTHDVSRRQAAIRYVGARLAEDTRVAGFRGCGGDQGEVRNTLNPDPASSGGSRTAFSHADFRYRHERYVEGFDAAAGDWSPALPDGFPDPLAGHDVLTLRGLLSTEAFTVQDMATTLDSLRLGGDTPTPIAAGDIAMIADCGGAAVFQVSAVSAATTPLSGGGTASIAVVEHATGGSASPGNWTADLDRRYGAGAQVWRVGTISWYLATSAQDGRPALWRVVDGVAAEIAQGVDGLQVLYGEDSDADRVADLYRPASDFPDAPAWRRVVAVRVALLFSGSRNHAGGSDARSFDLLGTAMGPYDDGRLRRVVTLTLALRNRLP